MATTTPLPTALHRAHTLKVQRLNCVEVDLHLKFGVKLAKHVIVEGVTPSDIPQALRSKAMACLVVLLGGKDLIVHCADDSTADGYIKGRVYVDEHFVRGAPGTLLRPHGLDEERLEVASGMTYAATIGYDHAALRKAFQTEER